MTKYNYITVICKPDKLEKCLQDYGEKGYRFIQLVILQKQTNRSISSGQFNMPVIETEFELIFETVTTLNN